MSKLQLEMIDNFQCPGCIHGTDTSDCEQYKLFEDSNGSAKMFHCKNWRPSTFFSNVGRIALGLPKGFTRTGMVEFGDKPFTYLRLYENPETATKYDRFNIPVWAMEREGYLFVRCYCPRNNWLFVDVIKDGKLEQASFKDGNFEHKAIDVGQFFDEID